MAPAITPPAALTNGDFSFSIMAPDSRPVPRLASLSPRGAATQRAGGRARVAIHGRWYSAKQPTRTLSPRGRTRLPRPRFLLVHPLVLRCARCSARAAHLAFTTGQGSEIGSDIDRVATLHAWQYAAQNHPGNGRPATPSTTLAPRAAWSKAATRIGNEVQPTSEFGFPKQTPSRKPKKTALNSHFLVVPSAAVCYGSSAAQNLVRRSKFGHELLGQGRANGNHDPRWRWLRHHVQSQ